MKQCDLFLHWFYLYKSASTVNVYMTQNQQFLSCWDKATVSGY